MLKLRVLSGPRAGRQIVVTDTEPVTIGRKTGRVRLHDSRVSKLHAEITLSGGAWVLRDNGSSNGSYVNHDLMHGLAELEPGDLLQFGRVLVKVEQADALGMMGLDTAPQQSAFDAVQAVPKNNPPRPETLADDDDELDLDALFAAEDGADSDDDDDFDLPAPKPTAVAAPPKPEPLDPEEDDDRVAAPSAPPPPTVQPREKSSVGLIPDADEQADDDPANQTDGEAPEILSPKLGPDADLIQIDDETPDAGKLPGSTVVLPESMMQTAVGEDGEADVDLAATPAEAAGAADAGDAWEELDAGLEPEGEQSDAAASVAPLEPSAAGAESPEPTGSIMDRAAAIVAEAEEEAPEEAADGEQVAGDGAAIALAEAPEAEAVPETEPEGQADAEAQSVVEADTEVEEAAEADTEAEAEDAIDPGFVEPEFASDLVEPSAPISETGPDETLSLDAEPPHDFDPEDDLAAPAVTAADTPVADVVTRAVVEPEPVPESEVAEEPAVAESVPDAPAEDVPVDEPADQVEAAIAADEPAADPDDEEDAGSAALAPPKPPKPLDDGDAVKPEAADQAQGKAPASDDADDAFDIDAAFADLESGLDEEPGKADTATPSSDISDDTSRGTSDGASADAAEIDPAPPQPGLAEGLANSQIDIAFIQDALASLPQVDDQQHPLGLHSQPPISEAPDHETRDGAADTQPQGSASAIAAELDDDADVSSAAALAQSPAQAPAADAEIEQTLHTPPGINPVTLRDPQEPRSSRVIHPERESIRRFLPAAIILLLVGAGAGYLLANGPEALTGRPDTAPQDPPASTDPSNTPTTIPPAPEQRETGSTPNPAAQGPAIEITPNPEPVEPAPHGQADTDPPGIGAAAAPEPFAQGPRILGPSVNPDTPATTPTGPPPEQVAGPGDGSPNLNPVPPAIANPGSNPGQTPTVDPAPGPGPGATASNPGDDAPGQNPTAIQEPADGERLVFLVDASGSSIDSLPQMLVWLDQALVNLEDPEQFTIIFFKQGQAIEVPPGGLKPMTREMRRTLEREWLSPQGNPVLPSGRSDPADALTLALGYEPSDIYLLSDASFARATGDMTREQAVAAVVDQLGDADIRLHGVQFFYQDESQASALQQLATEYNGTYEFVAEARQPDQDPIDLLQELENRNR